MNNLEKAKELSPIKFCKDNKLEIINLEKINVKNTIKHPTINRGGQELMGFYEGNSLLKNVICWGNFEFNWMLKQSKSHLSKSLNLFFSYNPPLVICSNAVNEELSKEIEIHATKNNVPLVFSNLKFAHITTTIGVHLATYFAQSDFVHGSLVIINGVGVLIIGPSGIGKSEIVLDLVHKGHLFVADDAVLIKKVGNNFYGEAPYLTSNLLEARGIGLINMQEIYGAKSIRKNTIIELVIELEPYDREKNFDRLGNKNLNYSILGGKINKIKIPITEGRNISTLVESAADIYMSRENEQEDPLRMIERRLKEKEDNS